MASRPKRLVYYLHMISVQNRFISTNKKKIQNCLQAAFEAIKWKDEKKVNKIASPNYEQHNNNKASTLCGVCLIKDIQCQCLDRNK